MAARSKHLPDPNAVVGGPKGALGKEDDGPAAVIAHGSIMAVVGRSAPHRATTSASHGSVSSGLRRRLARPWPGPFDRRGEWPARAASRATAGATIRAGHGFVEPGGAWTDPRQISGSPDTRRAHRMRSA